MPLKKSNNPNIFTQVIIISSWNKCKRFLYISHQRWTKSSAMSFHIFMYMFVYFDAIPWAITIHCCTNHKNKWINGWYVFISCTSSINPFEVCQFQKYESVLIFTWPLILYYLEPAIAINLNPKWKDVNDRLKILNNFRIFLFSKL